MQYMFGYRQHQPYGLSQVIPTLWSVTGLTAPIYSYMAKHAQPNGLACEVQSLHKAASAMERHTHTASLLLINIIHYTRCTHRARDF